MTRNLSLIPTIEAECEVAAPATRARPAPARATMATARGEPLAAIARARRGRATRQSPAARSRGLMLATETLKRAAIVLLFAAIAWPLYRWIGR